MTKKYENWQKAKNDLATAKKYVEMIGKVEPHLSLSGLAGYMGGSYGKFSSISITTQICFQPAPSATNYHECKVFDEALAEVITSSMKELTDRAMILLDNKAKKFGVDARDDLQSLLNEIDHVEKTDDQ